MLEVFRPRKTKATVSQPSSQASVPDVILRRNDFRSSTKLDALLQNLRKYLRFKPHPYHSYIISCVRCLNVILICILASLGRLQDQDPCFRAVVFSQFTSFLDLIGTALGREHITFCRFDGTMDMKKKSAAVAEFKAPSRRPKVLIISLKAGGVGLNVYCISTPHLSLFL